jgi:hypothetical protein
MKLTNTLFKRILLSMGFLLCAMGISAQEQHGFDLDGYAPKLVKFTSEQDAIALTQKGPVVYFFAAHWCPDCHLNYENLRANTYRLPSNLSIIFVDFDSSAALRKKLGVPIQSVYVQITSDGSRLKSWVGGGSQGVIKNLVTTPRKS